MSTTDATGTVERHPRALPVLHAPGRAVRQEPDILGVDVTMSQAKCLFVTSLHPGISMSALAAQLHVGPPAASGLVDRLVEHGYLVAPGGPVRPPPAARLADRRRPRGRRPFPSVQRRPPRGAARRPDPSPSSRRCSWASPPSSARPRSQPALPAVQPTKGPPHDPPDRVLAQAEERRHPARDRRLPRRCLLVDDAQAGAHPGHRAALRDGHRADARRGRRGRRGPGDRAHRACAGERRQPRDHAVERRELDVDDLRRVRLRHRRQGGGRGRRACHRQRRSCPRASTPRSSPSASTRCRS